MTGVVVPGGELRGMRAGLVPPVHACKLDAQVACWLKLVQHFPRQLLGNSLPLRTPHMLRGEPDGKPHLRYGKNTTANACDAGSSSRRRCAHARCRTLQQPVEVILTQCLAGRIAGLVRICTAGRDAARLGPVLASPPEQVSVTTAAFFAAGRGGEPPGPGAQGCAAQT